MRFLGIGDELSLGDMYMRLATDGHEVKVFVAEADSASTFRGLLDRTQDWRAELAWVKEVGEGGIILFESAHDGEIQDNLRRDGFNVIGGSSYGDRLELDRNFGQQTMREVGMQTAPTHAFQSFDVALEFVARNPARYVFKLNGGNFTASRNYVGELENGGDICALIKHEKEIWSENSPPDFVLMKHVTGVEVGVGAYFNGTRFLEAICLDWEHKRFFNGDLGELTGEMGTLVSYRHADRLFEATLAKMTELLRISNYVGYINLNTIVNEQGIWPLEFTCRFGYPGFAILDALHKESWSDLFLRMIQGHETHFETYDGFAVGVVLTLPPYPHRDRYAELSKGLPVLFRGELSTENRRHLHFDEVEMRAGQLLTSGIAGYLGVVTGRGDNADAAREDAYALARRVVVPNIRYRTDIGQRFITEDRGRLQKLGFLP